MRFRIERLCVLGLAAAALGGCVTPTPTYVALPPHAQDNVASTEVVAPIAQSEIYIYVPPTTAGQSNGLIGALIDASVDAYRAGTAETGVKPLRDAAVDMNFDSALTSQLRASLSQVAWLHVDGVRVVKEVAPKQIDGAITGSKDGAVMIAVADYHLSNDARQTDHRQRRSLREQRRPDVVQTGQRQAGSSVRPVECALPQHVQLRIRRSWASRQASGQHGGLDG